MAKPIRKLLKIIIPLLLGFFGLLMIYMIVALIGMWVPVNANNKQPEVGVEIFVSTNSLHADLIVPLEHPIIDWSDHINLEAFTDPRNPTYISFGWGDKNFYLYTPTMADLTIGTLFKALFVPSESAMHVSLYSHEPLMDEYTSAIILYEPDYQVLVKHILGSFEKKGEQFVLYEGMGYNDHDNFYAAKGKYSLLWTCNNWTNQGLKKAGVKNSLWTPFDWGVFYYLE